MSFWVHKRNIGAGRLEECYPEEATYVTCKLPALTLILEKSRDGWNGRIGNRSLDILEQPTLDAAKQVILNEVNYLLLSSLEEIKQGHLTQS